MSHNLPDPNAAPELFEGLLTRRAAAFVVDGARATLFTGYNTIMGDTREVSGVLTESASGTAKRAEAEAASASWPPPRQRKYPPSAIAASRAIEAVILAAI